MFFTVLLVWPQERRDQGSKGARDEESLLSTPPPMPQVVCSSVSSTVARGAMPSSQGLLDRCIQVKK